LVEMHGGAIKAYSEGEGRGATFTVSLPIPAVYPEPSELRERGHVDLQSLRTRSTQIPTLQRTNILAIDDSNDTRELLSAVLEGCGANVTTASSVREALDIFARWKVDIVICDIGMPEEDGYTFISAIRKLAPEKGGKTPAIALTGYVRVEDRLRALEAGYQMFVPKPIEAGELCTIVANLISAKS
jgi:CheY-like chemotaxis protein